MASETPDDTRRGLYNRASALFYLQISLVDRARRASNEDGRRAFSERADRAALRRNAVLLKIQDTDRA